MCSRLCLAFRPCCAHFYRCYRPYRFHSFCHLTFFLLFRRGTSCLPGFFRMLLLFHSQADGADGAKVRTVLPVLYPHTAFCRLDSHFPGCLNHILLDSRLILPDHTGKTLFFHSKHIPPQLLCLLLKKKAFVISGNGILQMHPLCQRLQNNKNQNHSRKQAQVLSILFSGKKTLSY